MVRLREVREELGYTQRELAEKTGIALSTISGIETGKHRARPATLRKLADAMGVDIREITRGPMVTVQMPNMPGVLGLVSVEDLKRFQGGESNE
jgi:transcriptional regulator with XRE-family HTH domain